MTFACRPISSDLPNLGWFNSCHPACTYVQYGTCEIISSYWDQASNPYNKLALAMVLAVESLVPNCQNNFGT